MRSRPRRFLLAALLLLLAAPPAGAQGRAGFLVGGQVTDDDGEPLNGARVELRPYLSAYDTALGDLAGDFHPPAVDRAVTGADGRYRLRAPGEGLWQVAASAPGKLPGQLQAGPLFADEELAPLALADAGEIELRVVDAAGRPVAGAQVSADRGGGPPLRFLRSSALFNEDRRRAVSGDDGRATLPLRDGETVRLVIAAPGHVPAAVEAEAGERTVKLAAGRPVAVTVVDPAGEPAAGVALTLLPFGDGQPVPWGVSGDDGRLTVRLGSEERLRLNAVDAAGRRGWLVVGPWKEEHEEQLREVTLTLAEPQVVTGRTLSRPERTPLAGAWVWADDAPHAVVRSDERGGFSLPLVGPRPAAVEAAEPNHATISQRLDGDAPAASSPLTLLLEPTAALAGRVVDVAGEPVTGALIDASPLTSGPRLGRRAPLGAGDRRTTSGGDGGFRLGGLLPEEAYQLTVTATGFAPGGAEVGGLEAGVVREGVEIVLTAGIVAFGRVVDENEEPVAGAAVALTPTAADTLRARIRNLSRGGDGGTERTTSGGEGLFELRDLAAGRFDLAVSASGFAPLEVPGVELPAGEAEVDLGTVLLAPGVTLEGRVTDADRRPIAGAVVTWNSARGVARFLGSEGGENHTPSDDDGRFQIRDLVPGQRVDLFVKAKGYAGGETRGVEPPTDDPVVVVLEPAAQLAGRVVDEAGAPVSGAMVLARGTTGMAAFRGMGSARSDDDGAFELDDLAPGKLTLLVQARGFQALEEDLGEVAAGERRSDLRLQVVPGATLTGRVLGADGQPVHGAVVAVQESNRGILRFNSRAAPSDAEGNYTLDGLPTGMTSFSAQHDDHVRAVRDLDVRPGDNRLDFRLERGLTVAGQVVDETGSPVLGAEVGLGGGMRFFVRGGGTTTDEDGRFEIEGVQAGTHAVSASKEGYATAVEEGLEVTAPVDGLRLVLTRGARIVGNLLGVDFEDLPRIQVLTAPSGRQAMPTMGTVDFEGGFVIEGVGTGTWTVMAAREDGRQVAEEVTIGEGEREVRVDLDLGGGGYVVSGAVTLGGRPLAGAHLELTGHDRPTNATGNSDQNGRFRLEGLTAGAYTLAVRELSSFTVVHRREIEVDGDLDVQIAVETAEVAGLVLDRATGAPLAGAEVRLLAAADGERRNFFAPQLRSDASGRFQFGDVADGEYRLRAEKDGYSPAETALSLAGGLGVDGVELSLEATRGLTLYVGSSLGTVPERVLVAVLPPGAPAPGAAPVPVLTDNVAPGEGGRVVLDRVPAGSWRLLVGGDRLAVVEVEATAPGQPVNVTLPPSAALDVTVPALYDTGRYGSVRLLAGDGTPWTGLDWFGRVRGEWELNAGRARLDRVPPGSWTVEVTTPDGDRRTAGATTTAGGSARVEVN